MGKKVVTLDQMIDLAIGTPESAVNFLILQKVLKLIARYCCKMDFKFELDMDDLKADITTIGGDSRSSFSESEKSYASSSGSAATGHDEIKKDDDKSTGEHKEKKNEKGSEDEGTEEMGHVKTEDDNQEHSTESKDSKSGNDKEFQKEDGIKKEKREDGRKKEKDSEHSKKKDESKKKSSEKKSSEKHKKRSSENLKRKESEGGRRKDSDSTKTKIQLLEDRTNKSESFANELENHLKELADRVETITKTISSHLDEKHLAEINGEIEQLNKSMENTSDQCNGVTNTINDQSSQIQDILVTISNIQLRKVENEELIDLLSGKADHSFVNEKVSTSQFEEIIQELKSIINENSIQMDTVRLETNTSLDEIKQELLTKLLAEEFDTAKTRIYKEIIKLTEQQTLILAQQNEHVSAGAKMRNLECFACNNDVVMLLEQETIPKFRGLKASLQALEPLVGSKINVGKNAPEWKNHQLKEKDFTKNAKASRRNSNVIHEKSTYVQGRNGYIYKGNVGCDCVEGINARSRNKGDKCCDAACCDNVEAKNLKNISSTSKTKNTSKTFVKNEIIENTGVGDLPKISSIDKDQMTRKLDDLKEVEQITEIKVEPRECVKIETLEAAETTNHSIDENPTIKTENETELDEVTAAAENDDAITTAAAATVSPLVAENEADPVIPQGDDDNILVHPDELNGPENNDLITKSEVIEDAKQSDN